MFSVDDENSKNISQQIARDLCMEGLKIHVYICICMYMYTCMIYTCMYNVVCASVSLCKINKPEFSCTHVCQERT